MAKTLITLVIIALGFISADQSIAAAPKKQQSWLELSIEERQILAPLESHWAEMTTSRRNKWVGIARKYKTLRPTEQENVKARMAEWAALTPTDRQSARNRFKDLEKMPPDKKVRLTDKWVEYQQLTESEREELRANARNSRAVQKQSLSPTAPY
jgi:hypothetical protein